MDEEGQAVEAKTENKEVNISRLDDEWNIG